MTHCLYSPCTLRNSRGSASGLSTGTECGLMTLQVNPFTPAVQVLLHCAFPAPFVKHLCPETWQQPVLMQFSPAFEHAGKLGTISILSSLFCKPDRFELMPHLAVPATPTNAAMPAAPAIKPALQPRRLATSVWDSSKKLSSSWLWVSMIYAGERLRTAPCLRFD